MPLTCMVFWLARGSGGGTVETKICLGACLEISLSSLTYYLIFKGKPFLSSSRALYQKDLPPPN